MLFALLVACSGGVALDDTAPVGETDDTANVGDTGDTQQQGFAHAGTWSGDVAIEAQDRGELCAGTVSLDVDDDGELEGQGDCILMAGPGAGEVLTIEITGQVAADGDLSASAEWLFGPPDNQTELQAAVVGEIDGELLNASFEAEQAGPDGQEAITLVGTLDAERE
jgi:hypothetical protein